MKRVLFSALMITGLILSIAGVAYADGIIIPDPPPGVPSIAVPNLAIKYHRVNVTIDNQVAPGLPQRFGVGTGGDIHLPPAGGGGHL